MTPAPTPMSTAMLLPLIATAPIYWNSKDYAQHALMRAKIALSLPNVSQRNASVMGKRQHASKTRTRREMGALQHRTVHQALDAVNLKNNALRGQKKGRIAKMFIVRKDMLAISMINAKRCSV